MATKPKRVLIVQDDAESRTLIRDLLKTAGYEPAEAGDGPEGLAKAERLHPDMILLDVRLPGLDGYAVCRDLKAKPETTHIPVIFVTAVADDDLNRLAFEAGAMACIMKPFRYEALLAVIEAALANAKRRAKPKARPGGKGR